MGPLFTDIWLEQPYFQFLIFSCIDFVEKAAKQITTETTPNRKVERRKKKEKSSG